MTNYINAKDFFKPEIDPIKDFIFSNQFMVNMTILIVSSIGDELYKRVKEYIFLMPEYMGQEDSAVVYDSLLMDLISLVNENNLSDTEAALKNNQNFLEFLEEEINNLRCSKAVNQSSIKLQETENDLS